MSADPRSGTWKTDSAKPRTAIATQPSAKFGTNLADHELRNAGGRASTLDGAPLPFARPRQAAVSRRADQSSGERYRARHEEARFQARD